MSNPMDAMRVALGVPDRLADRLLAMEARLDALANWQPTVSMPPLEIRWVPAPAAARSPAARVNDGNVRRAPVQLHQFRGQPNYSAERCLFINGGVLCDTARNVRKNDHMCANHRHYLNIDPVRVQRFVSDMDLNAARFNIPDSVHRTWADTWAADHAADAAAAEQSAVAPVVAPAAEPAAEPIVVVPSSVVEAAVPEQPVHERKRVPALVTGGRRLPNVRRRVAPESESAAQPEEEAVDYGVD